VAGVRAAASAKIGAMPTANVFTTGFEYDGEDPEGYRSGVAHIGRQAGGTENVVKLFEIPPGQNVCPYHYEYVEEWLLVLEGDVMLRTPDGERPLGRGAVVCFPAGPAGAHKLRNDAESAARVLMFSSAREPSVAVYPDSDKLGVWTGNDADELMLRRADGAVEYYDGER
jgi:uncharacterized cupin superfamily protein